MDADHRHELKTNDLEEFLTHFKDFWARWGNAITIAALVVVIAFTGWRLYSTRQTSAKEKTLSELATATTPAALMSLGRETSDASVRPRAYLRGADKRLYELVAPAAAAAPGVDDAGEGPGIVAKPLDSADRQKHLDEAARMYRQAIEHATHPVYVLNARLGLGAVAEFEGKWDEARQEYERVVKDAGELYAAHASQAKAKLAMLDRLMLPVTFAPEPQPQVDSADTAGPALPEVELDLSPDPTPPVEAPAP